MKRTTALAVLAALVVLALAGWCRFGQAAPNSPDPDAQRSLRDLQDEYEKVLVELKARLGRDHAALQRLVALHERMEKRSADHILRELETMREKLADLKKENDDIDDRLRTAMRAAIANSELKIRKLERKVVRLDLLASEPPKAKILAVDAGQQFVRLNVGTAERVKPGLTFSVFGDGQYRPDAERKASVEIVEVIDAHLCRARVTELRNAVRQPLVVGDLLYNPSWTPGLRDRVAILGIIDLDGDGQDDTPRFVAALEQQGVIVDLWLDAKELAFKGQRREITFQTNFLILGEFPELVVEPEGQPPSPRQEKEWELRVKFTEFHEHALAHGVTFVNARRYLALAGMKVPPVAGGAKDRPK